MDFDNLASRGMTSLLSDLDTSTIAMIRLGTRLPVIYLFKSISLTLQWGYIQTHNTMIQYRNQLSNYMYYGFVQQLNVDTDRVVDPTKNSGMASCIPQNSHFQKNKQFFLCSAKISNIFKR